MSFLDTVKRFEAKIGKPDANGCWPWNGATSKPDRQGYGLFWPERRTTVAAHRFSYEYYHEIDVPSYMDVHHKCYNTLCVNPDHLEHLTKLKNTQDYFDDHYPKCKQGHERTPSNTYYRNDGRKDCLKCRQIRSKNR